MQERLQKIIAAAGLVSRRAAEEALRNGRVSVNGRTATLGEKADPDLDEIRLDGATLCASEEKVYLMLHKPRGYVCTLSDEKGRKTVADLVQGVGTRVFPVGRLDLDSEGLLLMTNDGEFANRLMHPSHEVDKTYLAWTEGEDPPQSADRLSQPLTIDGYKLRPAKVRLIRMTGEHGALLSVTIHEGRNRQVRKMCDAVGLRVTRLLRVREGSLELGDLPSGKWRPLTKEEIDSFR